MIQADVGTNTPLELMLYDGDSTRAVRVTIRRTDGTFVTTVNLSHVGEGLYTGLWSPATIGYYHANYIVYTDGSYSTELSTHCRKTELYKVQIAGDPISIAAAVWDQLLADHEDTGTFGWAINEILSYSPENTAQQVWEELLADYTVVGTTGWALSQLLLNTDPSNISQNVWDVLVNDHRIPNTFGDYIHAIHQYCNAIDDELNDPTWGLDMIYALINSRTTLINDNVLINTGKINDLVPLIEGVEINLTSEIIENRNFINAMSIQNAADKAQIIAEIDENELKIDTVIGLLGAMQNNTTARFVVPDKLVKPTTGTKNYQFHLRLYDAAGEPKAPDSTPTIRIRRLDTGVDIVSGAPMTQDGVKVGAYYYTHTISAGTDEYPALVEVTVVEDAVARYLPSVTEITEFETDLAAIQSAIASVDAIVSTNRSHLESPTYGLSALKSGQSTILGAISSQNLTLSQIKSKTDLIPTNIATRSDIDDILSVVVSLPVEADIQGMIDLQTAQLKGPDNRNLTDVYDLWDTSTLLKTNDPRLNYLDAYISSRSTLTAGGVWSYGTRTLTEYHLDPDDITAIWAYLGSQATTPGSLGKKIADLLDVAVSTRASRVEMEALLAGVAQESTLEDTRSQILNELALCCMKLDAISSLLLQIKVRTDKIPNDPARESTVVSQTNTIISDLSDIALDVNQIRLKTDLLPPDPASNTTVLQIPTNPLRSDDARLGYLDAYISSRSTLSVTDLNHLATESDLLYTQGVIVDEVEINRAVIGAVQATVNSIKTDTDRIPLDPSTLTALSAAESSILEAIASLSLGGGATAEEVWEYADRTLTDPFPDISSLATKSDVTAIDRPNYRNRMTTTFTPQSNTQEVLVWTELDGQRRVDAQDCTIIVKDSQGNLKWTASASTPSSDGIFRFVNPIVISSDANYYIIMSINVDGSLRISQQAFITVG